MLILKIFDCIFKFLLANDIVRIIFSLLLIGTGIKLFFLKKEEEILEFVDFKWVK